MMMMVVVKMMMVVGEDEGELSKRVCGARANLNLCTRAIIRKCWAVTLPNSPHLSRMQNIQMYSQLP